MWKRYQIYKPFCPPIFLGQILINKICNVDSSLIDQNEKLFCYTRLYRQKGSTFLYMNKSNPYNSLRLPQLLHSQQGKHPQFLFIYSIVFFKSVIQLLHGQLWAINEGATSLTGCQSLCFQDILISAMSENCFCVYHF